MQPRHCGQQPPVVVPHPSVAPSHVLSSSSSMRVNLKPLLQAHSLAARFWALQTPRLEAPRGGFKFIVLVPPPTPAHLSPQWGQHNSYFKHNVVSP